MLPRSSIPGEGTGRLLTGAGERRPPPRIPDRLAQRSREIRFVAGAEYEPGPPIVDQLAIRREVGDDVAAPRCHRLEHRERQPLGGGRADDDLRAAKPANHVPRLPGEDDAGVEAETMSADLQRLAHRPVADEDRLEVERIAGESGGRIEE